MNKKNRLLLCTASLLLLCGGCQNKDSYDKAKSPNVSRNYAFEDEQTRQKVSALMEKMTLDEKIAQLCGIRPTELLDKDRKFSIEQCRKKIPHGIGHVSQFSSSMGLPPDELREFVNGVQQFLLTETPSRIPVIFHEECITGFTSYGATTYPQHIGAACSWNPDLIEEKTAFTAATMRSVGCTQALSPMLDVCKTPYFERMEEGFGEDGYLTSRLGLAFVNGLQRGGLDQAVSATAKHYAGYAGFRDEQEFYEETLMPFEAVIRLGGAKNVMPGYHKYNDVNCIGNKALLSDILRTYIGFDGVVVSDYGAINHLGEGEDAAVQAMNAGADVELPMPDRFLHLKEALADGSVSQERFDEAVRRALTLKLRLGLLNENPNFTTDGVLDFDPPAHREAAYQLAAQSVVLLKNDGILPLREDLKKIALVGPNAAAVQALLGDYTYQSMSAYFFGTPVDLETPHLVTLLEGLQKRLPQGVELEYERGCVWNEASETRFHPKEGDPILKDAKAKEIKGVEIPNEARALQLAAESDIVIAAMGENVFLTGEGRDRGSIRLPIEQERFLQKIADTGKPLALIIFGGRPLYITDFEPHCAAILQAWYPGEEGGTAVADILTGKVNPSAKLCMSYPKDESRNLRSYAYGYNDTDNVPLYPFGHGLSYTSYSYSNLSAPQQMGVDAEDYIDLSFEVKNDGQVDGTEIVQLYLAPQDGAVSKDNPVRLRGFARVNLKAGEMRKVGFRLYTGQLARYKEGKWVLPEGKYNILIGASSTDIRLRQAIEIAASEGDRAPLDSRNKFFSEAVIQ